MKDDEPGIELARLHKVIERGKRAVAHAIAQLEREGFNVPEDRVPELYRLAAPVDILFESDPNEIIRKIYQQFGKQPPKSRLGLSRKG